VARTIVGRKRGLRLDFAGRGTQIGTHWARRGWDSNPRWLLTTPLFESGTFNHSDTSPSPEYTGRLSRPPGVSSLAAQAPAGDEGVVVASAATRQAGGPPCASLARMARAARHRGLRPALAGLLAALLACCGCGSDAAQSLGDLMLSSPPIGFHTQVVGDGGSLSLDDAASATPIDPARVRASLQHLSWRAAYARVWVNGAAYIEDLGFAFGSDADARAFADFEVAQLQNGVNTYVFALDAVPRAQVFIVNTVTRIGGRNVYCDGVWFPLHANTFEVLACADSPGDWHQVAQLATDQYRHAGGP
jgi:hypothetical protein